MPFQESNTFGAKKILKRDLDDKPTCVKLYAGHKEALRSVKGWQGLVRDFIEKLIDEHQESTDTPRNP